MTDKQKVEQEAWNIANRNLQLSIDLIQQSLLKKNYSNAYKNLQLLQEESRNLAKQLLILIK